ncbi:MAG: hypothetical protein DMG21_12175 [Acidobacteria bacterium]|nr:MAG: hypothetical protein DMG21_12175 [Acidobacteriota bacterium]
MHGLAVGVGEDLDLMALVMAWEEARLARQIPGHPQYRVGLLFGEFVGSVIIEVPSAVKLGRPFPNTPFVWLGMVINKPELTRAEDTLTGWRFSAEPQLTLREGSEILWREKTAKLAEYWSKPFREVVE